MTGHALSAREQHALQHLHRALELGTSLQYYATAHELDLEQLLSGKAQLERKGLWPIKAPPPKALLERRTELLAVKVVADTSAAEPTEPAPQLAQREGLRCRLTAPNGWVLECDHWPQAQWLTVLMGGAA